MGARLGANLVWPWVGWQASVNLMKNRLSGRTNAMSVAPNKDRPCKREAGLAAAPRPNSPQSLYEPKRFHEFLYTQAESS